MKILVTGGTGFIGSFVSEMLLEKGYEVICADNFDESYDVKRKRLNIEEYLKKPGFSLAEIDLTDKDAVDGLFREHPISRVIHGAAKVGVRTSVAQPLGYLQTNCCTTLNLLEASKEHRVEQFIYLSSYSVYGKNPSLPSSETDSICMPTSPYASSKAASELLCFTYSHLYSLSTIVLRIFTTYGPRQRPDMAITRFARLMALGREVEVYGDGVSEMDYVYIDDVVKAVALALEHKFQYEIFNIGTGIRTKLTDIVALLEKEMGMPAKAAVFPVQPGDMPISQANIEKAKKLLYWQPKIKIEDGIARFVKWFKENEKIG